MIKKETKYLNPASAEHYINDVLKPVHFSGIRVFTTLKHLESLPTGTLLGEDDLCVYKLKNIDKRQGL